MDCGLLVLFLESRGFCEGHLQCYNQTASCVAFTKAILLLELTSLGSYSPVICASTLR